MEILKKYGIYAALALGVIVMLLGNVLKPFSVATSGEATDPAPEAANDKEAYAEMIEKRLSETLSQIQGVGSVYVMVTLQSGEEKVLATDEKVNEQTSSDGADSTARRTEQTQKDSKVTVVNNQPLILTEMTPKIEGVVVVADGADNPEVQSRIYQATIALTGVKSHKVAIFSKK